MRIVAFALVLILAFPVIGLCSNYDLYAITKGDGSVEILKIEKNPPRPLLQILKELQLAQYPIRKVEESDFLSSRADRDFWKVESGKIVVDQQKKQEHINKIAEKEAKKNAVLSKLKISEAEWKEITDKEVQRVASVN